MLCPSTLCLIQWVSTKSWDASGTAGAGQVLREGAIDPERAHAQVLQILDS